MGTVGRIASGVATDLVEEGAEFHLKVKGGRWMIGGGERMPVEPDSFLRRSDRYLAEAGAAGIARDRFPPGITRPTTALEEDWVRIYLVMPGGFEIRLGV